MISMNGDKMNPLLMTEVLQQVCSFLSFQELKGARLVNRTWLQGSTPAWSRKALVNIEDIDGLRDLLATASYIKKVLPYTTSQWTIQGLTVHQLWGDEGHNELELLKPFWPTIKSLNCFRWKKKVVHWDYRMDYELGRWAVAPLTYYRHSHVISSMEVTNMLKLCENLTSLAIHFEVLSYLKGGHLGPRQFPQLEKLTRLEIYFEGKKWSDYASADPNQLVQANMQNSDSEIMLPRDVSGGNALTLRLLDHSPNLASITVTSGTLMTSRVETWFIRQHLLLAKTVTLPKLREFRCSIPIQTDVCKGLESRSWGLRALHLKTLPGAVLIPGRRIYDMIVSFRETLQHLELIFIGPAWEPSWEVKYAEQLYKLETLELWGYGGTYSFLTELKQLRHAVIGLVDSTGGYSNLEEVSLSMPNLKLELKTGPNFIQRLDLGPRCLT